MISSVSPLLSSALRVILVCTMSFVPLNSQASTSPLDHKRFREVYQEARAALAQGQLQEAYEKFSTLQQPGWDSAQVDLALGTTAAMLERPGEALAHLERALTHQPRNRDARFNWQLLHSQLGSPESHRNAYHNSFLAWLSPAEWFKVASFAYVAAWALMAVAILNRGPSRQPGLLRLALGLLVVSVGLATLFFLARNQSIHAAYIGGTQPVPALSGPNPTFSQLTTLQPGTRVFLRNRAPDNGHLEILLPQGVPAYVQQNSLIPVFPQP